MSEDRLYLFGATVQDRPAPVKRGAFQDPPSQNGHRPSLRRLARAAFHWNDSSSPKKSPAVGAGRQIRRSQHQGNHPGVFADDHVGVRKARIGNPIDSTRGAGLIDHLV